MGGKKEIYPEVRFFHGAIQRYRRPNLLGWRLTL